jgi:hypothetical protein
MGYMTSEPTRVWVLPAGLEEPRLVSEEERAEIFTKYSDTGYEPKLEYLYKAMDCSCIDLRRFPFGDLWLDDEGLFKAQPTVNPVATVFYARHFQAGAAGHPVVGTCVLVVHPDTPEGEDERLVREAYATYLKALEARQGEAS